MAKKKAGQPADTKTDTMTKNESAAAVGALLGFCRRLDGRSQMNLSEDASLNQSEVALYESGKRLPSKDALSEIAKALDLEAFLTKQLQLVAGYPNRADAPGHEWIVPEDVLQGIPIFLRRLDREYELQRKADISEMWVVTMKPLALSGKMYEMLRERLQQEKTKFVYFVGSDAGEQSFQSLWRDLCSDSPKLRTTILKKLECILAPESICLNHFGICNPGQQSRMFGRAIMYQNGLPVGFYGMDSIQLGRAYEILDPTYRECVRNVGKSVQTKFGTFRMIKAEV